MSGPRYHLEATLLPDGDRPVDLWVVDGRRTFRPQDDAVPLAPPGGYVLPGLVDCHAHLTLDIAGMRAAAPGPGALGGRGLPIGSPELVAGVPTRSRHDQ